MMKELIDDTIASLEEFADPNRIFFANKSYPTSTRVIGVANQNIKIINKVLKSKAKSLSTTEKIELAKELCQTSIFECQQIAYEFVGDDKTILNELTEADIDDLGINLDNWVFVDSFGVMVVGFAWRVGTITIEKIKSYLKSNDHWIRRVAVVATIALNQKANGETVDVAQTLEICELVVDDHQEKITKALSMALQELAKRDKEPVIEFIELHKEKLNKKVLKEVTSKLKTERKHS